MEPNGSNDFSIDKDDEGYLLIAIEFGEEVQVPKVTKGDCDRELSSGI